MRLILACFQEPILKVIVELLTKQVYFSNDCNHD